MAAAHVQFDDSVFEDSRNVYARDPKAADIIWEGFMLKQGGARGGFKTWRKRWIRITLEDLSYYKHEADSSTSLTVLGVMPLKNATILDVQGPDDAAAAEEAPLWDVGACKCEDCGHEFSSVWRRRFCRSCGFAHCSACSPRTLNVSKYGMFDPVRVCNKCFNGLTSISAAKFQPPKKKELCAHGSIVRKSDRKSKGFEWRQRKFLFAITSLERELFLQADTQTTKTELITVLKSVVLYHKRQPQLMANSADGPNSQSMNNLDNSTNRWALDFSDIKTLQQIGVGSFGTVSKGRLWGTAVAVKRLKQDLVTEEDRENLVKEVTVLSQLRHPNVVLYIGACLTPPNICIVTEWCERGSLFNLLYSEDPNVHIDMQSIVQMATGIAQGMNYLHSVNQRVIHRDLKSQNILIDSHFTPKVADFGLSHIRFASSDTASGRLINSRAAGVGQGTSTVEAAAATAMADDDMGVTGTAEWMAPEVMEGAPYNQSVDIYSFGIVLTELLTRRIPFRDKYAITCFADVVEAVLDDGALPTVPAWCGSRITRLVHDCLDRNPDRRPTFTEIILRLSSFYPLDAESLFVTFDVPRLIEMLGSAEPLRRIRAIRELEALARDLDDSCQDCGHLPAHLSYLSADMIAEFVKALSSLLMYVNADAVVHVITALHHILGHVQLPDRLELISIVRDAGGILRLSSYLSDADVEVAEAASKALSLLLNDVSSMSIMGLPLSALEHLQKLSEDAVDSIEKDIRSLSEELDLKTKLSKTFELKARSADDRASESRAPATAASPLIPLQQQQKQQKQQKQQQQQQVPKPATTTVTTTPNDAGDAARGSFEGTPLPEQMRPELGDACVCWGWVGMLDESGQLWRDVFAVISDAKIYIFNSEQDEPERVTYIIQLSKGHVFAKFRLGRKRGRSSCLQIALPHELLPAAIDPSAASMQRFFLHMGEWDRYNFWLQHINSFLEPSRQFPIPSP